MNRVFASLACLFILTHMSVAQESPAAKVRTALDQVGTLEFANLPLDAVAERLQSRLKVKVALHESLTPLLMARLHYFAVAPGGVGAPPLASGTGEELLSEPGFSCKLENMRLGTSLRVFLDHYSLGYVVLGDRLILAGADKAEQLRREQPVELRFEQTTLANAAADLSRRTGVDVILDAKAPREAKITLAASEVSLDEGVKLLAEAADLQAAPTRGGWLLTTPARAAAWAAQAQQRVKEVVKEAVGLPLGADGGGPLLGGMGEAMVGGVALVQVPRGLLQIAGPPPRVGQVIDAGKKSAQAVPLPPAVAPKKSLAAEILKKLGDASEVDIDEPMILKEFVDRWEARGLPRLVVDQAAFKNENPDGPDLFETPILARRYKGLPNGKVLRSVLDQVPTNNATFLVRPGYIVITTMDAAAPNQQFVQASFSNRPLDEVLWELSELTGITIALDPRVGEKAKTPITARFPTDVNLAQAVRLLADMADLRAVRVDTMMYVTSRTNNAAFPPEPLGPGRPRTEAVAQSRVRV